MSFSFLNKIKFAGQYVKLMNDPTSLENVISINFTMAEIATEEQKTDIVEAIRKQPLGAKAMKERYRIDTRLEELQKLPFGTLGRSYFEFLKLKNLNPADLPVIDSENNGDEFTYARAHLFETHDLWHVLTGFDTDVAGEMGLQAFYLTQFPATLALILFSSGFLSQAQQPIENSRRTMEAMIKGYTLGKCAHDIIGRNWNEEWHKDLTELQSELGIEEFKIQVG